MVVSPPGDARSSPSRCAHGWEKTLVLPLPQWGEILFSWPSRRSLGELLVAAADGIVWFSGGEPSRRRIPLPLVCLNNQLQGKLLIVIKLAGLLGWGLLMPGVIGFSAASLFIPFLKQLPQISMFALAGCWQHLARCRGVCSAGSRCRRLCGLALLLGAAGCVRLGVPLPALAPCSPWDRGSRGPHSPLPPASAEQTKSCSKGLCWKPGVAWDFFPLFQST